MVQYKKNALLVVDPQNDFCDQRGSLYVDGAASDITRLAEHITRDPGYYDGIFVSLDSHDSIAIFHPKYWTDDSGKNPAPYTAMSRQEYRSGTWRPASGVNREPAERFFDALEKKGIESLMIWPEHCVISTWGHQITDTLREALSVWRDATGRPVRFCLKGENPHSEQFSVFEGIDDSWEDMKFNERVYRQLREYESLTIAGEALSHCVVESAYSYMKRFESGTGGQSVRLLEDCTSPVAGFERQTSLERIASLGIKMISSR